MGSRVGAGLGEALAPPATMPPAPVARAAGNLLAFVVRVLDGHVLLPAADQLVAVVGVGDDGGAMRR